MPRDAHAKDDALASLSADQMSAFTEQVADLIVERLRREGLAVAHNPMGPKLLLNALEAAELLGVSDTTIRELWGAGHLKFVRIGKGRKVTRAELERYITEHEA